MTYMRQRLRLRQMSPRNLRTRGFMKTLPGNFFSYELLVLFHNIDLSKIQILQNLYIMSYFVYNYFFLFSLYTALQSLVQT